MSEPLPSRLQDTAVELLRGELSLGFAKLRQATSAPKDAREAIFEQVRRTLKEIRETTGRIQDPAIWKELHTEADRLEQALDAAQGL